MPYDAGSRFAFAPEPGEHDGLSGTEADARARAMVRHAAGAGTWFHLSEHLTRLRQIVADAKDGPSDG